MKGQNIIRSLKIAHLIVPYAISNILHFVPGELIFYQKYPFIKKSTIFIQSLPNIVKIRSSPHEYLILTKFRNDWVKIVDFLIKVYF